MKDNKQDIIVALALILSCFITFLTFPKFMNGNKNNEILSFKNELVNFMRAVELNSKINKHSIRYDLPTKSKIDFIDMNKINQYQGFIQTNNSGNSKLAIYFEGICGIKSYGDTSINFKYLDKAKCTETLANNMVNNGYLESDSNYNFTGLTYKTDKYLSTNIINSNKTYTSNNFIMIEPNKKYRFSAMIRSDNPNVEYSIGFSYYDRDKNQIEAHHSAYVENSLTYLTKDLVNGDKVVHIDNLKNFIVNYNSTSVNLGLIFWNYFDGKNKRDYAPLTYSRNSYIDLYNINALDYINNTITLKKPWNGPKINKGIYLSQTKDVGNNSYPLLKEKTISNDFVLYTTYIEGLNTKGDIDYNKFRYSTDYIKLVIDINSKTEKNTFDIKDIIIEEIEQ